MIKIQVRLSCTHMTICFLLLHISGCFYGDPHIVNLDGFTWSFNGLGEYTLVTVPDMDYELQGRTGFAMVNGTVQESGGTVFIAFAAKMGITTVGISYQGITVLVNNWIPQYKIYPSSVAALDLNDTALTRASFDNVKSQDASKFITWNDWKCQK